MNARPTVQQQQLDPRYLKVVSPAAALDPDAMRVLEMVRGSNRPPVETQNPQQAREAYALGRRAVAAAPPEVGEVSDFTIEGALRLRLYRGAEAADVSPTLLYLHGGGWVLGDLESHDSVCRSLANAAHCRVLAVDYRLAPEHRFPAALEDAIAAARWLWAHATELGVDLDRVGVGGDSAGANLAAVLALLGRDGDLPAFSFQMLIYPATDLTCTHDAHRRDIPDLSLTPAAMRWFIEQYLGNSVAYDDWRVSPLRAGSLAGTPPAVVLTVGHDPLCDEGAAYAARLKDDGVPVTYLHLADQIHGFISMGGVIRASARVLQQLGNDLARHWRSASEV